MEAELKTQLRGYARQQWEQLLRRTGLEPDPAFDQTVLLWDAGTLVAAGSRRDNLLKCIAVDPDRRGEDLTATVLSRLRSEAFARGFDHLFLYTKPENRFLFQSLFFYPVARTDTVLLMESIPNGIRSFLAGLPKAAAGETVGAAVMNCNPFTLGHRYLIETAARECSHVYVFVLSEDKSYFSAHDRMEMVRLGTQDLPNVTVLPTGPYLISSATFPTYFLKDRENADRAHCALDIEIFRACFVPHFGITHRYVGTEPLSPLTAQYNEALRAGLKNISIREIPRLETPSGPVSASQVRQALDAGQDIRTLVPETTFQYLIQGGNINA